MKYRYCNNCHKVFSLAKSTLAYLQKHDIRIRCPFCGSSDNYIINKEQYERIVARQINEI